MRSQLTNQQEGIILDVRRGRRYENFFGIPVPIIPWMEHYTALLLCVDTLHTPPAALH